MELHTKNGKTVKIPSFLIGGGVIILILALLVLATFFTGVTMVKPGEVALIKNNITGAETAMLTNGTVVHLPFGFTQVYKIDKRQQMIEMTGVTDRGDRPGDDSVQVKTLDGSNVNVDVEVQYQIIPTQVGEIIKTIGRGDAYTQGLVRSYARSIIRDELGKLSVIEIADSTKRDERRHEAKRLLNEVLAKYGMTVILVNVTNPVFNQQYTQLIMDRKAADQEVRNQAAEQKTAQQEQEQALVAAGRERNVAVRQAKGKMNARLIAARAEAERDILRARGKAVVARTAGDQRLAMAQNEAAAIEKEGLSRATAIRALADAYEKGGLSLVREALAEKYKGVKLRGRPYSLSSHVDRLQLEKAAAAVRKEGK